MAIALSGRFFANHNKSHEVKFGITWSISPDENNNIGLVYTRGLKRKYTLSTVYIASRHGRDKHNTSVKNRHLL